MCTAIERAVMNECARHGMICMRVFPAAILCVADRRDDPRDREPRGGMRDREPRPVAPVIPPEDKVDRQKVNKHAPATHSMHRTHHRHALIGTMLTLLYGDARVLHAVPVCHAHVLMCS